MIIKVDKPYFFKPFKEIYEMGKQKFYKAVDDKFKDLIEPDLITITARLETMDIDHEMAYRNFSGIIDGLWNSVIMAKQHFSKEYFSLISILLVVAGSDNIIFYNGAIMLDTGESNVGYA